MTVQKEMGITELSAKEREKKKKKQIRRMRQREVSQRH